jgi:O-6-methylguanine DNA methyltransferase
METDDRKWIVVRIDGKIAAVSTDYRMLASISAHLAGTFRHNDGGKDRKGRKKGSDGIQVHKEITATSISFDEVWRLRHETGWDDMMLFGTDFQKKVWRQLWEMTHREEQKTPDLTCYSDFAELCQNRAGVRAVAHAIGLNPVAVLIPCHLVVPKEAIDKINAIRTKAESTIFKGEDLCLDSILKDESIDFGEYSLGRNLKRELITLELTGKNL